MDAVATCNDCAVAAGLPGDDHRVDPQAWLPGGLGVGNAVLAGVAELEREIIRERQAEGIKAAQKRGVQFGRKPKLTEDRKQTIRELKAEGKPISEIKAATGMSKSSIYVALRALG